MKNMGILCLVTLSLLCISCSPLGPCTTNKPRLGYDYSVKAGLHRFTDQDDVEWHGVGQGTELWATGTSSTGEQRTDENTVGDKREAPAWSNYDRPGTRPRR
jgi:hypothetical protein